MRYFYIPTIPFFSPAHVFLCDMIWILHNSKRAREYFARIGILSVQCRLACMLPFFVHLQGELLFFHL